MALALAAVLSNLTQNFPVHTCVHQRRRIGHSSCIDSRLARCRHPSSSSQPNAVFQFFFFSTAYFFGQPLLKKGGFRMRTIFPHQNTQLDDGV